ncbi:5-methyltetrahydropteroyltriglutamate--homocysteine S-methyltransferase, partial [bacterium]|nr:5-methyltetrahydropteroyltriglutamate--homocysteine S-methyltransferase [bacterium]
MAFAANLGFPRLGINREWKKASERYWAGKITRTELIEVADELTTRHWQLQEDAGIDITPTNDFAFYDLVLDTAVMLGAIPSRYAVGYNDDISIDTYFTMARGRQDKKTDVTAMEMTKWFDTNYHYIVPEFSKEMNFRLASEHPFSAVKRAQDAGVENPRPVLIGPMTFLLLGKTVEEGVELDLLLDGMLDVYELILERFKDMGVDWVQIDEPSLVLDLSDEQKKLYAKAYKKLTANKNRPNILLTTYFGGVGHNKELIAGFNVEGIHLDLVRAPEQLDEILSSVKDNQFLSLGVVDGRNIWRTDLDQALSLLKKAEAELGNDRLIVAPSCSLLHSPIDLDYETKMDEGIKEWLAFGKQKLQEISALTKALNGEEDSVKEFFEASRTALERRRNSEKVHDPDVKKRLDEVTEEMYHRETPFADRWEQQVGRLHLPTFPTTTIGSFPQTQEIRKLRADLRKNLITAEDYEEALKEARGRAHTIAQETRDKLNALTERQRAMGEATLTAKLEEAEARIAASKSEAMAKLDDIATETASAVIGKLIG